MTNLALLSAGGAVVAYLLVRFLFSRDTAVENRRLEAIKLSDACTKNGLPLLGKVLQRYAVGDYSGLAFAVSDVKDVVSDPDQLKGVVDTFLGIQLDKKLSTAEGREELIKAIEARLGIEIPREVVESVRKTKLFTEDDVDQVVSDALLAAPSPTNAAPR